VWKLGTPGMISTRGPDMSGFLQSTAFMRVDEMGRFFTRDPENSRGISCAGMDSGSAPGFERCHSNGFNAVTCTLSCGMPPGMTRLGFLSGFKRYRVLSPGCFLLQTTAFARTQPKPPASPPIHHSMLCVRCSMFKKFPSRRTAGYVSFKGWGHLSDVVPRIRPTMVPIQHWPFPLSRISRNNPQLPHRRHHWTLDVERWALDVSSHQSTSPPEPSPSLPHRRPFTIRCSVFDVQFILTPAFLLLIFSITFSLLIPALFIGPFFQIKDVFIPRMLFVLVRTEQSQKKQDQQPNDDSSHDIPPNISR